MDHYVVQIVFLLACVCSTIFDSVCVCVDEYEGMYVRTQDA